jgi:hypothetical protein
LLTLPVGVLFAALIFKRRPTFEHHPTRQIQWFYWSFIIITIVLVLWMKKYYLYHFAMFEILLVPSAALGVHLVLDRLPRPVRWPIAFVVFEFFALPREMLFQGYRAGHFQNSISHGIHSSFEAAVGLDSTFDGALDYLQTTAQGPGPIEICSFDPRLRAYLAAEPATRYSSLHPIGLRTNPSDPFALTDYQREWRRAYIDSLARKHPSYLVIQRNTEAEYLKDPYADVLRYVRGFDSLLSTNYRLDTTIGENQIYRLVH